MTNVRRNWKKYGTAAIVLALLVGLTAMAAVNGWTSFSVTSPFKQAVADETSITEGPMTKVIVTAGPFDLHRHYLSMEGPWVAGHFTPGDMVASKNINLPEGMVSYLENGGGAASMKGIMKEQTGGTQPEGLVHAPNGRRELYWFKGVKLEVLDENGVVQPTAEFICHWNLDVDPQFRNKVFTDGHYTQNDRLSSISQGETVQILPAGFGVPVASDEPWQLSFQAANRTSDVHRRVRHRCTLYFVKDSDLVYPIKALYWYVPYVTVIVDKNDPLTVEASKKSCPMCIPTSEGVDAPNDKAGGTFSDQSGRVLSGHWVIPPGEHTYRDIIQAPRDSEFQKGNPVVRAAWTHVHPLCTKLSLVEVSADRRAPLMSADCRTKLTPGLQIMQLDFLAPKGGVQLHESSQYELEVTYSNPFKTAVDSMASMGIYMEDPNFKRPRWALHDYKPENDQDALAQQSKETQMSCAITNAHSQAAAQSSVQDVATTSTPVPLAGNPDAPDRKRLPLFDPKSDGPSLSKTQNVEIITSSGPIDITLEPKLAPMTCTHIFELMKNGSYVGTPFFDYQPNEFLVLAQAVDKRPGQNLLTPTQMSKLRRLPLEASPLAKHTPMALSLCRDSDDTNSATSCFCMVLGTPSHLDGHYTVFGHVVSNPKTQATMTKIEEHWNDGKNRPYIVSCKVM